MEDFNITIADDDVEDDCLLWSLNEKILQVYYFSCRVSSSVQISISPLLEPLT